MVFISNESNHSYFRAVMSTAKQNLRYLAIASDAKQSRKLNLLEEFKGNADNTAEGASLIQ
jgi:hypothetical protein